MASYLPTKKPQNGLLYLIIIALILSALYLMFGNPNPDQKEIPLNTLVDQIKSSSIEEIKVENNRLNITLVDGTKEYSFKEQQANIYEILERAGVTPKEIENINIQVVPGDGQDFWVNLLVSALPFLLIVGFFIFMMKQAQGNANQAMSFGKSKARMYDKEKQRTTFDDVAGAYEAKEELVEIVDFLKNPGKYSAIGAKIPKGVLLLGSPGTGKTLLSRAVAGEANVPFFSISGSEFVEMFVGVGAARVRDLFKKAKRNAPCIIFIDEIDAVGRHRGAGMGGGHDEREQTLNQILTEMDGFEKDTNVIVMAATNRPDVLDPALLRPGRFDRRVIVDMPDIKAREEILKVHARGKPLDPKADLSSISKQTPGFTGADLENLMNEAAILTARQNKKIITMEELELSIEKISLGPERKSHIMSPKEKKITAYHEVGHAIVAHLSSECDPVHKVSIVSRGMANGVTWTIPDEDKTMYSKTKLLDDIAKSLGGYVAEEVMFSELTTGASNDLEKATGLARRMVTEFGMSHLGPIIFGEKNQEIFLGRDFGHVKNYSEAVAAQIDAEIKDFINQGYKASKEIITKNKDLIRKIAEDLIQKETLSREEFAAYFKNHPDLPESKKKMPRSRKLVAEKSTNA